MVYVVVVLVGGALTGRISEPTIGLSVLATAVVALAFDPVQSRLEDVRVAGSCTGAAASPYDVLRSSRETATGSHRAEELPARMARVLAEGTGAEWAQVWLVVDDRPDARGHLAADAPAGARATLDEERPGRRSAAGAARRRAAGRPGACRSARTCR